MPKILGQDEQKLALKKINAALKDLAVTNKFLESTNPSGAFSISFVAYGGEHFTSELLCEDKAIIDGFVRAYKERLVGDMMEQAEKNRIELLPEDLEVFGLQR